MFLEVEVSHLCPLYVFSLLLLRKHVRSSPSSKYGPSIMCNNHPSNYAFTDSDVVTIGEHLPNASDDVGLFRGQ